MPSDVAVSVDGTADAHGLVEEVGAGLVVFLIRHAFLNMSDVARRIRDCSSALDGRHVPSALSRCRIFQKLTGINDGDVGIVVELVGRLRRGTIHIDVVLNIERPHDSTVCGCSTCLALIQIITQLCILIRIFVIAVEVYLIFGRLELAKLSFSADDVVATTYRLNYAVFVIRLLRYFQDLK